MEYFYVAGSLASLLAFMGYIIDRFTSGQNRNITYTLISAFIFLSVIFWTWFYLAPNNTVREIIKDRIYDVKSFQPNLDPIGISTVEATFEAKRYGGTIFFPSFTIAPEIFIKRPEEYGNSWNSESKEALTITQITSDSFNYSYSSPAQDGEWVFRARGKLLKIIGESSSK